MGENQNNIETHTHVGSSEINLSWTIENFSLIDLNITKKLESQKFSLPNDYQYQWRIWLYPDGDTAESKSHISLYLVYVPHDKDKVTTKYKFSLLNKNEVLLKTQQVSSVEFNKNSTSSGWGIRKFCRREEIVPLLKDDVLIVKCWIRWGTGIVNVTTEPAPIIKPDFLSCRLSDDLSALLGAGKFSDVLLVANDGTEFKAHKCILVARSEVFAAMFEHEMKESKESRVEIQDLDADTLKAMLEYVYSNKFGRPKRIFDKLLIAADKYALDALKELCALELGKKLSVENAANCLLLADRYNKDSLKTRALKFIVQHLEDVLETEGLKNLRTAQACLFEDILRASVSNKKQRTH